MGEVKEKKSSIHIAPLVLLAKQPQQKKKRSIKKYLNHDTAAAAR